MKPEELEEIITTTRQILANLEACKTTLDTMEVTMTRMEALGMTDAHPTYREGKYLYLVGPMINGSRTREYIGSDPAKIRAALDKIDRYNRHRQIFGDYCDFSNRLRSLGAALERLQSLSNPKPKGW